MRVEVEHLPESQVQLQIEIDPDMLGQAVGKAYQKLAGRYRVPGFRPGKAPRAVLERAIGPEVLLSEAADICMNDAYAQAIKENDLHPLGHPDVQSPKSDEIASGKALNFTATVYVRPHVQLGDYQSLRLKPTIPEVSSEDVDRVLKNVQDEQAPWKPIEDSAAEIDDLVTLRLLATVGEETLVDQDSWEYRLREDEAPSVPIPGLSRRLVGMRTGETKDDTIDLPEDYSPAEYAGKQLTLHVEMLRIDRKEKPEIDDTFAQSLGEFETVDALREKLTQNMQAETRRRALDAYVENVLQQVVDQATVSVPPPLVDEELDEMMQQLQDNVERERKISMDTYARILGKSIDELRTEARPTAEQRVRSDLVLDAIAEQEGINAPVAEIDSQIRLLASQPTYSNKERRRLLASDGLRERVARRLRKRYVINKLLEIANPTDPATASDSAEHGGEEATTLQAAAPEPAMASAVQDDSSNLQNEQEN